MAKRTKAVSLIEELTYWAVVLLGVVLLINAVIGLLEYFGLEIDAGALTGVLNKVALAIAIIATLCCSFTAAKKKGGKWLTIWIICAILVALTYVLGITLL